MINDIGNAYFEIDSAAKSPPVRTLNITRMLKANMENKNIFHREIRLEARYRVLIKNLLLDLSWAKLDEELLEMADEGLEIAKFSGDMALYGMSLGGKAWALAGLGRKDEGKKIFEKYVHLSYVLDGYAGFSLAAVKGDYETYYKDEPLDLCIEW